jgi:cytochrome P450
VLTSAHATSHDPQIFASPELYNPDRWLDATKDMRESLRAFSYGPRNCVGKNLAHIGLVLTISRLYQLYDVENDPCMTDAMMRPKDRGVTAPWDAKVVVRPTRVH